MNWKLQIVAVGLIAAAIIAFVVLWPIQRAINGYETASANYDRNAMCTYAHAAARAWAEIGAAKSSREWDGKAALDCIIARTQPRER